MEQSIKAGGPLSGQRRISNESMLNGHNAGRCDGKPKLKVKTQIRVVLSKNSFCQKREERLIVVSEIWCGREFSRNERISFYRSGCKLLPVSLAQVAVEPSHLGHDVHLSLAEVKASVLSNVFSNECDAKIVGRQRKWVSLKWDFSFLSQDKKTPNGLGVVTIAHSSFCLGWKLLHELSPSRNVALEVLFIWRRAYFQFRWDVTIQDPSLSVSLVTKVWYHSLLLQVTTDSRVLLVMGKRVCPEIPCVLRFRNQENTAYDIDICFSVGVYVKSALSLSSDFCK